MVQCMQDDYQSAQLFLDTLTFIIERWEFLLGLLLGGGGTYTTITLKKKHETNLTQKGESSQAIQVVDSPHANTPAVHSSTGVTQLTAQRDIIFNSQSGIAIGSRDVVQQQVQISPLDSNRLFLCSEIERLLASRNDIYNPQSDYERTINFLSKSDRRNAATLILRIYMRANTYFQAAQYVRDENRNLSIVAESLTVIQAVHDGSGLQEDLNALMSNIETAVRGLISSVRT